MKSLEIQNIVFSKQQNGNTPLEIYQALEGVLSLATIKRWCKMIMENGSIELKKPPGRKKDAKTVRAIQTVKRLVKGKERVTIRKLAAKTGISFGSAQSILKKNLQLKPYKIRKQPLLTMKHLKTRFGFYNWVRHNFKKEDTERILFSDEKIFNINGVYNVQNDRIWAVSRANADKKGGINQKRKFPQGVMVWLAVCSKGCSPLVLIEKGTINQDIYIKKILPVAKKYGNKVFGNKWTYQQDGATCHTGRKSIEWCSKNFPNFIPKNRWPPNSPDLNPLDYCIWNDFVRSIRWDRITSKKELISELKTAVKKIDKDTIVESCKSWYRRLYRMWKANGEYIF